MQAEGLGGAEAVGVRDDREAAGLAGDEAVQVDPFRAGVVAVRGVLAVAGEEISVGLAEPF